MPAMLPNTGGVLYGTITVGSLLGAESATRETYGRTVGAVAIALLLYWLVHSGRDLIVQTALGAVFGLLVIALNLILH